jgi:hypothetical protein
VHSRFLEMYPGVVIREHGRKLGNLIKVQTNISPVVVVLVVVVVVVVLVVIVVVLVDS